MTDYSWMADMLGHAPFDNRYDPDHAADEAEAARAFITTRSGAETPPPPTGANDMATQSRFIAVKDARGVWGIWDQKTDWWAFARSRWMTRELAEAEAQKINRETS